MDNPVSVLKLFWDAECRRDIPALMDHLDPGAIAAGPGDLERGYDEIRAGYEASVLEFPGIEIKILGEFRAGDRAAVEYEALLTDSQGRHRRVRGVKLVQVRHGKLASLRSYEDPLGEPF